MKHKTVKCFRIEIYFEWGDWLMSLIVFTLRHLVIWVGFCHQQWEAEIVWKRLILLQLKESRFMVNQRKNFQNIFFETTGLVEAFVHLLKNKAKFHFQKLLDRVNELGQLTLRELNLVWNSLSSLSCEIIKIQICLPGSLSHRDI